MILISVEGLILIPKQYLRNQMLKSRAEWRGETDNWATTPVGYCPSRTSSNYMDEDYPARPDV